MSRYKGTLTKGSYLFFFLFGQDRTVARTRASLSLDIQSWRLLDLWTPPETLEESEAMAFEQSFKGWLNMTINI